MDDLRSLGHYRIESVLGEGGMGMVYLAFDTHLERRVAIKVLHADALSDPDRKRRFVQEAKAASALNHPNIVIIHDIAQQDEVDYIVMEYIPGETLSARIKQATSVGAAIAPREVISYALQIAGALARAHAAGIVHRDIKPDNVIVNEEGRAKVLDFGLAKLIDTPNAPNQEGPGKQEIKLGAFADDAEFEREGTIYGSVLGTAEYMSPEQARGESADARSDVFSFGAMLFELLTGRNAFAAASKFDAMQAVIHREPSILDLGGVPPPIAHVVLHCLQKDPAARFQRMEDLQTALEEADKESRESKRFRWWMLAIPAGMVAMILVVLLIARGGNRDGGASSAGGHPRTNIIPVTSYPGQEIEPSISPDGTRVAFIWDGEDGRNLNLYVKNVEGGEPLRLSHNLRLEAIPVWSPDGKQIAFLRRHVNDGLFDVMIIAAAPGAHEHAVAVSGRGLDWSPDGKSLVIMEPEPNKPRGLLLFNLDSGETRRLTSAPATALADRSPRFSPDGTLVAFARAGTFNESTLYVVPVSGGEPRQIFVEKRGTLGLDWTADSKEIVYAWASVAAQPSLYRVPVAGGVPEAILSQAYHPSIARHANRMAFQQTIHNQNIWRILRTPEKNPGRAHPLISSSQTNTDARYSRDGTKIAFNSQRSGNAEIWIADAEGHHATQITSGKEIDCGSPSFSPDGAQLVFDCHTAQGTDVFTAVVAKGVQSPKRLTMDQSSFVPGWSRDGKWIYYTSDHGRNEIWRIPAGGGTPVQITKDGGYEAKESLDGGTLYFTRTPGGDGGLWTIPLGDGNQSGGTARPVAAVLTNIFRRNWDICGSGVVFVNKGDPAIKFYDFKTQAASVVYPLDKTLQVFNRNLAISPDGRSILVAQVDVDSRDISVMDHFR